MEKFRKPIFSVEILPVARGVLRHYDQLGNVAEFLRLL